VSRDHDAAPVLCRRGPALLRGRYSAAIADRAPECAEGRTKRAPASPPRAEAGLVVDHVPAVDVVQAPVPVSCPLSHRPDGAGAATSSSRMLAATSRASARGSATGMLASTRKRKRRPSRREHRPGRVSSSPMSTRSSQRPAMVLADGQVISTPFSDSPRLRVLRRPQLPSTRRLHGVGARRT
jgi:hypothetical protein